ncbi:NUDIX hydrolase [Halosquirtibacter laminarini]|uniref:NUDIX hydrolase n=1 Tax=Halosquirtibacter laminarini TaxID=3374600 RepID=A0AC61NBT5_9BACT|nr:NUDIX hydrolase [Prolixibacteraceae bacterium]
MSFVYKYPRPAITVDTIVIAPRNQEMLILLIKRKEYPFQGSWALPGGFINMDELLLDAAARELEEETGISGVKLSQFFTFDAILRDPRQRILSSVFHGELPEPVPVKGMDDALEAKWFPIISLPEMAFDHNEIIRKFVREKL